MSTLSSRLPLIANDPEMSDVKFIFGTGKGKTIIYGHKVILASTSPVFKEMFYSKNFKTNVVEGQVMRVMMVDHAFDAEDFLRFIKFVYSDEIKAEQLQELTVDLIIGVISCADYYDVLHVKKSCVKYLEHNLTYENVIAILEAAKLFTEDQLGRKALEFIDRNFEDVTETEESLFASAHILLEIFKRESLLTAEFFILDFALKWADKECERQKLEPSVENKRKVLGPAFFEIRFALLPSPRITKIIRSGLLTPEGFALLPAPKVRELIRSRLLTFEEVAEILRRQRDLEKSHHRVSRNFLFN